MTGTSDHDGLYIPGSVHPTQTETADEPASTTATTWADVPWRTIIATVGVVVATYADAAPAARCDAHRGVDCDRRLHGHRSRTTRRTPAPPLRWSPHPRYRHRGDRRAGGLGRPDRVVHHAGQDSAGGHHHRSSRHSSRRGERQRSGRQHRAQAASRELREVQRGRVGPRRRSAQRLRIRGCTNRRQRCVRVRHHHVAHLLVPQPIGGDRTSRRKHRAVPTAGIGAPRSLRMPQQRSAATSSAI